MKRASIVLALLVIIGTVQAESRTSIETSVLWPVYPGNLFLARAIVPVTASGDLIVGAQGRVPEERSTEGTFHNLDVHMGWRWTPILRAHLEGVVNLGWGHIENSTIDGKDYDSFDGEIMILAGWTFGRGPVYLLLQPVGAGYVFFKSNPWPIEGEGTPRREGPIFIGNVSVGFRVGSRRDADSDRLSLQAFTVDREEQ